MFQSVPHNADEKDQNHLMVVGDVAQWVEHSVYLISVTPASRTQEDEDSRSSLATQGIQGQLQLHETLSQN